MAMFEVPLDEIRPERINLPDGQYQADFMGAQVARNDKGWAAVRSRFENWTTVKGELSIARMWKGREVVIDLATRARSAQFTSEGNPDSVRIGASQIAGLAQALGVGEFVQRNGKRAWAIPGDTTEEIVDALNERVGARVNLSVRNKPRKRQQVAVTNDQGEPIIDDEISRVWPVDG